MKRIACVVALLLAMIAFAISPLQAAGIMVGVKGGLSVANLYGDDVYNNSITYGGTAGAFMRYAVTGIIAVQPEVLFAMKGAKYESEGLESQQKINYIEIPLLAMATLPNTSKIKPNIFAGPAIGILLSNKITNGEEIDIKDASRSADIGLVFGAGAEYSLVTGSISLDVRYELGLTSTMQEEEDKAVKNSVISIMVGYGMQF